MNTRDRILDVADQLLYTKGIRAVGIDELIEVAGVAKATLYRHFPSKEDIVVAYLEARSARLQALHAGHMANAGGAPLPGILAAFEGLSITVTSGEFRGCAFLKAVSEFPDSPRILTIAKTYKEFVRNSFLSALPDREGRDELAGHLALLYEGAISQAVLNPDMEPVAQARKFAESLLAEFLRVPNRTKNRKMK